MQEVPPPALPPSLGGRQVQRLLDSHAALEWQQELQREQQAARDECVARCAVCGAMDPGLGGWKWSSRGMRFCSFVCSLSEQSGQRQMQGQRLLQQDEEQRAQQAERLRH